MGKARSHRPKPPDLDRHVMVPVEQGVAVSARSGDERQEGHGKASTWIEIRRRLTPPDNVDAILTVLPCHSPPDTPGHVIATKPRWDMVIHAPATEFATLVALVAAQGIKAIEFVTPRPRYGKAPIVSILLSSHPPDQEDLASYGLPP